jgi:acyl-CoA thioester hydrolase
VNNTVYLQYLESARVGYFEALGRTIRGAAEMQYAPVVVSQTFNYHRQVRYPDELEIGARCREIRHRSFVLAYAIFRKGTETLLGDGSTVLVWLDYAAGRAAEIPGDLRQALDAL